MEKTNPAPARAIGQTLSVALTAVLFGSTMILSAVGPARASDIPVLASTASSPAPARYLA